MGSEESVAQRRAGAHTAGVRLRVDRDAAFPIAPGRCPGSNGRRHAIPALQIALQASAAVGRADADGVLVTDAFLVHAAHVCGSLGVGVAAVVGQAAVVGHLALFLREGAGSSQGLEADIDTVAAVIAADEAAAAVAAAGLSQGAAGWGRGREGGAASTKACPAIATRPIPLRYALARFAAFAALRPNAFALVAGSALAARRLALAGLRPSLVRMEESRQAECPAEQGGERPAPRTGGAEETGDGIEAVGVHQRILSGEAQATGVIGSGL